MIPETILHFTDLLAQAVPLDPGPHNILRPGAPQGSHIEWLYWFTFWILLAVYVLMVIGFTRAGAKSHVATREPLPVMEFLEGDRKAKWAVGAAVAVTVITLFVVLAVSVATGKRVTRMTTSKNPVTINIIGHQWWWEVTYPLLRSRWPIFRPGSSSNLNLQRSRPTRS
jgi:cytochrome c oxidase subunit 2